MALSIDLSDRVALVTGAAGGLGRAIALDLARAGAHLLLVDIAEVSHVDDLVHDIECEGRTAHVLQCDVADPDAVRTLAAQVPATPSILVNNAGHYREYGAITEVDDAVIDRTVDINLKGVLYLSREFSAQMLASGNPGTIINISSGAAHSGRLRHAHYCASKAGVLAATRAMAIDVGPQITVNSISVGFVDVGRFDGDDLAAVKRDILPRIPLGAGHPSDISSMVCYLASPHARWITGSDFRIDGGESAGRIPLP